MTITLPATTDCDAQGAICADGDYEPYRKPSHVQPPGAHRQRQRLRRFKEEPGLSWSEISRHLGTYRTRQHHLKALLDLADNLGLGLGHLFTERGCVIAGSKTQTGPKHALPGMTPRQMWPFLLYLRSRDTWPSFTTPFSSLNIASKCLLGSVANEPCAISCGGQVLNAPVA